VLAKTGKQNACERCKSLFYTPNIYTFIKDEVSSTVFSPLSPAAWVGRFARDALAKRPVPRRSKFELFNVRFACAPCDPFTSPSTKAHTAIRGEKEKNQENIFNL